MQHDNPFEAKYQFHALLLFSEVRYKLYHIIVVLMFAVCTSRQIVFQVLSFSKWIFVSKSLLRHQAFV